MTWPAALLAVSVVLAGKPAFRAPPARQRPPAPAWSERHPDVGQVRYVTSQRVHLDRGTEAGLRVGAAVYLLRGDEVLRCVVDRASEGNATCRGAARARVNDRFRLTPPPAKKPPPLPPALPSPDELVRRKRVVEALALAPVEFDTTKSDLARVTAPLSARVSNTSHLVTSTSGAAFHQQQVAVRVDGAELLPGVRAFADLLATRWVRPDVVQALQPGATQLHVRWAELAVERSGAPWGLSAGRTRPGLVPGQFSLDGLALRLGDAAAPSTVSVFAGLMPEPVASVPSWERPLAGVAYLGRFEGKQGAALRLVDTSASLTWSTTPELGTRVEAQAAAHAQGARWWDVHGQVRLGVGQVHAPGYLDEVRLDASLRPADGLRLVASASYTGLDALALLEQSRTPSAVHAQAAADWAARPWLSLGVQGGLSTRLGSELSRAFGQVQLGLPRLYGTKGGVWASAQLERGWLSGRTLALRTAWRPAERVSLWARVAATQDGALLPDAPAPQEVGVALGVEAGLTGWLSLGGSLSSRLELPPLQKLPERKAPAPAGLAASVDVRGRW